MRTKYSVIIFYDSDKRILFQNRGSISKSGEEWGFFGGGVESGESFDDALLRETKEELNIALEKGEYKLVCTFSEDIKDIGRKEIYAYISPFKKEYQNVMEVLEGDGAEFFSFSELKKLKVTRNSQHLIGMLEKYFKEKNEN